MQKENNVLTTVESVAFVIQSKKRNMNTTFVILCIIFLSKTIFYYTQNPSSFFCYNL